MRISSEELEERTNGKGGKKEEKIKEMTKTRDERKYEKKN